MRDSDNDSGSEQRQGWQPPEYVSPWAPASSAARASDGDVPADDAGTGDTVSFGPAAQEPEPGQPGPAEYGPPSYGQSSYGQSSYGPPSYGPPSYGPPSGYGQRGPGFGQPSDGGYGGWNGGGGGQQTWVSGYGTPPPPPGGSGLRRFLVYAAVAVLAAGAGAGAAVELSHTAASTSASGSPAAGNGGTGTGNGGTGEGGSSPFGGNPFSGVEPSAGTGNGGSGSGGTNAGTGSLNATALAGKVDPGVVDIDSTLQYNDEAAEGTGMVISAGGLVLTNNHVIDEATSISVTEVTSGKTYPAKVVGYDASDDVAVLQMELPSGGTPTGLTTVALGDSDKVALGDAVLAIGNAQGKGGLPSTAQGIVNAKNRDITASDSGADTTENLTGMLQTDAPIQEGDSGGPLVNASAQVIGMDTAANTSGGFDQQTATTGFAIPINKAITIAHEIVGGQASATVHIGQAGFIGVGTCPAGSTGGGSSSGSAAGAYICEVYPKTPAASAGLQQGDVITAVDGTHVASATALSTYLFSKHPGDKLTITYTEPNGATQTTTLTLGSLQAK